MNYPVAARPVNLNAYWIFIAAFCSTTHAALAAEVADPLLRDVPPHCKLQSNVTVNRQQADAIGKKLGGQIKRLTNSRVMIHGRSIGVNIITAADNAHAVAIHESLLKIKPFPFCVRRNSTIVEYVGRRIDDALAYKTSFEIGILEKPERVKYRVVAQIATIDQADYMACNSLFSSFLKWQEDNGDTPVQEHIAKLSKRFRFGDELKLRRANAQSQKFETAVNTTRLTNELSIFQFVDPPRQLGVPYVTATMTIAVDASGLDEESARPTVDHVRATSTWPVEDPYVVSLSKRITQREKTTQGKVDALIAWLTPGTNIRYAGETGSRWGTLKTLKQKFGRCWDFSDCFITLARAAGIPCRQTAGWLYGSGGHVWAEYYRQGKGWQQVDPTAGTASQCGIYHIPYFTTSDGEMPIVYLALPKITML